MGYDSFIDLFEDESIRVTTFKKLEKPKEIEDFQIKTNGKKRII